MLRVPFNSFQPEPDGQCLHLCPMEANCRLVLLLWFYWATDSPARIRIRGWSRSGHVDRMARDWGPVAIPSQKFAKFRKPSTSSVPADLIPLPQCLISREFNVLPMWVLWQVLPRFQPRKLKAVVTNLFPYVAQQLCIFNSNWVNLFIQHSTNICPELLCTWGTYLKGKGRVGRVGKCLGYGITREIFLLGVSLVYPN